MTHHSEHNFLLELVLFLFQGMSYPAVPGLWALTARHRLLQLEAELKRHWKS